MAKLDAHYRKAWPLPAHADLGLPLPPFRVDSEVRFRHPGYEDKNNLLLRLPALDHENHGVHYGTAMVACGILANNVWTGFFTEDQAGLNRVEAEWDHILQGSDYYFRVSGDAEEKYPIVPNFKNWEFPHDRLPENWLRCLIPAKFEGRVMPRGGLTSAAVLGRDVTCRISNFTLSTERAHLIPQSESAWFDLNMMSRYAIYSQKRKHIDDPSNAILLRSDIHTLFDEATFAIVPKPSHHGMVFVSYVLIPGGTEEAVQLYHNVALQDLAQIRVQYLFARFAWSIFAHCNEFFSSKVARNLYICEDGQIVAKFLPASIYDMIRMPTRSRSSTPASTTPAKRGIDSDSSSSDSRPHRGRSRTKRPRIEGCMTSHLMGDGSFEEDI